MELHDLLRQVKKQDDAHEYLNRQLMLHIKEKHEAS